MSVFILDYSADWYFEDNIGGIFAVTELSKAVLAVHRPDGLSKAVLSERIDSFVSFDKYRSALAAVSAVRTACFHRFFSSEGNGAISAFAACESHFYFVIHF